MQPKQEVRIPATTHPRTMGVARFVCSLCKNSLVKLYASIVTANPIATNIMAA